jgi:hypothetical protein
MSEISILEQLNYTSYIGAAEIYFRMCTQLQKEGKSVPSTRELSVKTITGTLKQLEKEGRVKRKDGCVSDTGPIPKWKLVRERNQIPPPQQSRISREIRR